MLLLQTVDLYSTNPRYHIITNGNGHPGIGGGNGLGPPTSVNNGGVLLSPIPPAAVNGGGGVANGPPPPTLLMQQQNSPLLAAAAGSTTLGHHYTAAANGGIITSTPSGAAVAGNLMFQSRTLRSSLHNGGRNLPPYLRSTSVVGGEGNNGTIAAAGLVGGMTPLRHQNVYTMSAGAAATTAAAGSTATNPRTMEHIYQVCM